jgi:hypothetical protein
MPAGRGHAIVIGETSDVRSQGLAMDQIYAEYWRSGCICGQILVDW